VEQFDSAPSALTLVRGAQAETLQRTREANLSLAGGLVKGLRAQQRRWSHSLEAHPIDANKLAGACSLAAAFLCYAGPLSAPFRARALAEPMQLSCRQANVLLKPPVDVEGLLSEGGAQLAKWRQDGLPRLQTCTEGAFLATLCPRGWPLLIDPHSVAVRWIARQSAGGRDDAVKQVHVVRGSVRLLCIYLTACIHWSRCTCTTKTWLRQSRRALPAVARPPPAASLLCRRVQRASQLGHPRPCPRPSRPDRAVFWKHVNAHFHPPFSRVLCRFNQDATTLL